MLSAAATRLSPCDVFDLVGAEENGGSGHGHLPRLPRRHKALPLGHFRRFARPACFDHDAPLIASRRTDASYEPQAPRNADWRKETR